MRLLWCSDVHLNFLPEAIRQEFYKELKQKNADAVVLSGDIGESHDVVPIVSGMEKAVGIPVYFVLGNHDFYGSSTTEVRESVKKLNWLQKKPLFELTPEVALVGVDGWGDCRNGDYENSRLVMNDWNYIEDLLPCYKAGPGALKVRLQELADKDASLLKRRVRAACKKGYSKIFIVTHVPPFEEACLHAGRKSTPSGLPFFSSKVLGESIVPITREYPEVDFLWLCGHTHSRCTYEATFNLTVKVADAQYFMPKVEEIIEC